MKKVLKLFVFIGFFLGTITFVSAQVTTSSLSGTVKDSKGEALEGATVKATHVPSGSVYYNFVQKSGSYFITTTRIGGPYVVEVSFVGYTTKTIDDISLALGEDYKLDIVLAEDAEMISEAVVTGTQNSTISSNRTGAQEIITREKMDKLPTINRSLSDFTKLTPMSSSGGFGGASYRFNNVTVDGASFNNSFGLSSALGATGTEPISLEALEQVQVMIAPFDVRNGGFTGAGINSVTKSGSNEFHGSAYSYTKSPDLRGYRVKDQILPVSEFTNRQYGISVSGPIIKNKLFFYLNAEMDRQENPINYTTANSVVDAAVLQDLSSFLQTNLNYSPGFFDLSKRNTEADRLTARLDWNINDKNKFSLKYYYLKSFNTNNPSTSGAPTNGRGPNQYSIPFSSTFYRTNSNFNIVIADLNTVINSKMTNYFKIGYSAIRDFRDMDGGFFPQVDILNGNNQAYTTFGTEGNSYNNKLDTDIFQIQDNFIITLDKHQITIGTQSDYRAFVNGFAQNYPGAWVFKSIDDFKFNVLATQDYLQSHNGNIAGFDINNYDPVNYGFASTVDGITNSASTGNTYYGQKYAIGDNFPFAKVNVLQLGFYVQDKWKINDNLNITFGLRMDLPIFTTDLPENPDLAKEVFRDEISVDVSKYPNARPLFSPRFGFNYRALEDKLQIRGGTGLFTGTPPYVWLSNQAGNNGILFGDIRVSGAALSTLGFTGSFDTYKPANGTAARADISITDTKFKYPTLWKTNIAADYKFGDGWIATIELLYSKDINAIYHDNIGIVETDRYIDDGSGKNVRPAYSRSYYSDLPNNNKKANHVVMLRNTSKGYAFFGTAQIQKTFNDGLLKGLYLNASFTTGVSKGLTDGSSSVAYSAWQYRQAIDPNSQEMGYNASSFDGRLLASALYTANWSKNSATSFGLVYQMYRPFRYSYTYSGDANNDYSSANDLIYIPRNFSEVDGHLQQGDFASVEEAWLAMDAFISQDQYLSKHRGEYAERNGAVTPFVHKLDFSISHDIKVFQKNGRSHTLRFSFDIDNFLNLLNKDWGVQRTTVLGSSSSPQYQFLTVYGGQNGVDYPNAGNNYTLKYTMRKGLTETLQYNNSSYWTAVFGIKYIF
ncbi:MAG: carboxypeptidase regulatory-like domain-containing protein [Prevotellaceae bacterium]|jgi:hypothetical protein|nr:carboxypeptidase regulatory-like domain-containing protein [Prevotellaceae bacterium]